MFTSSKNLWASVDVIPLMILCQLSAEYNPLAAISSSRWSRSNCWERTQFVVRIWIRITLFTILKVVLIILFNSPKLNPQKFCALKVVWKSSNNKKKSRPKPRKSSENPSISIDHQRKLHYEISWWAHNFCEKTSGKIILKSRTF